MRLDVPHLKMLLTLGLAGLLVATCLCTWVYPCYEARFSDVKQEKIRDVWENIYGISDHSIPVIRFDDYRDTEQPGGEVTPHKSPQVPDAPGDNAGGRIAASEDSPR